ncbi:sugar ABC transporter substrate-binding protein [Actinosynnema sp. ALI-1.44]|uniref:sugar ABC transporter substrate-binding protein n=1 Tax=Actinosynnema sp. ALI-1.44 TaxID=1933779 RepID=UPI001EDBAA97|nr:substrate-binding domain-containing protein [Actinosynnema sp. ALI-1.44]
MWFAMASGGVAAFSFGAMMLIRRTRNRSRRAFLITSAFGQKYYVADFVLRAQSALDSEGIDLVLKVPDRDYDASAQSHHLGRLLDRRREYVGGIIFAGEVHRLRDDLVTFCRGSRLPVVFTDIEPFDKVADYPPNSAYIGYDTGELGEQAGQWLARHLRGKRQPRVLIVASLEHSTRQERCEKILRRELPDVMITTEDRCGFVRSRACDAVRAHVRQMDPHECLDAIFCTNDEMALGAVDALSTPSSVTRNTVVVGIDGVLEAKALIDTTGSPLRATVVQDTHRLAGCVVDLLIKMHRGRTVPTRTILKAEMYVAN